MIRRAFLNRTEEERRIMLNKTKERLYKVYGRRVKDYPGEVLEKYTRLAWRMEYPHLWIDEEKD